MNNFQNDIQEFIKAASRHIRPYNELVFENILNLLELMTIRMEEEEKHGFIIVERKSNISNELNSDIEKIIQDVKSVE